MKRFRQNLAMVLIYIAASPFLLVRFLVWLFSSDKNRCEGCPKIRNAYEAASNTADIESVCEECRLNHKNKRKKKNRKCQ